MKLASFNRKQWPFVLAALIACGLLAGSKLSAAFSAAQLEAGFVHPPESARPWVYWFWLNGNITSNGITADLEAMKRVGIGGVLIMEVNQGTPRGSADFGGARWRELFKHVCAEANRLGLEVNMNNDAGWCGSGGPWITPELAMQKLVWTETNVVGPLHFEGALSHPQTVSNYYQDITVFAFPTPARDTRIENIQAKAAFIPEMVRPCAEFATLSAEEIIERKQIVDLGGRLESDGHFTWDVPAGAWTILRLGHTPTGKDNHPAPEPGRGLESDKLSGTATDAMFAGLMQKLVADSKPLAGKTLVATHIDSWETGSQNWTPRFREEFIRLRGYDPRPYLPVVTGRVVDSLEISERFLWDLRQTVSDLLMQNYAGRFRELAHQKGLRLSIEAYDRAPCDEMSYAGEADEPMAEFWSWGYNAAYSCTEMASAAHVYGKRILGAEAFTATDGEKWLHHPASIKALGDWAFCEGINRFVFHRYALQPWDKVEPGMSMGPWGLHYERTQTWWEQSSAWHQYLARCQFLLQQGLFVADVCYLEPEGSPQRFTVKFAEGSSNTPERPQYNFDGCSPEVVLTRMKVKNGRLVLPDGMSYRLLVLPEVKTMTPKLLAKIVELVKAGATVIGSRPMKSPSLSTYPACDFQLKKTADGLWGDDQNSGQIVERKVGKGHVIFGEALQKEKVESSNELLSAKWIWHAEGNPAVSAPVGARLFRRVIELRTNATIASAEIALTADNSFELWVNGRRVGNGNDFNQVFHFDLKRLLNSGTNIIAIKAENGSDKPNPAGLIASVKIEMSDSQKIRVATDREWESSVTAVDVPKFAESAGWQKVMELGPLGMAPWNMPGKKDLPLYEYPEFDVIANILNRMDVPPDFEADGKFRYIHRRLEGADFYFVANPDTNWVGARCAFRVTGKVPELWNPLAGEIKSVATWEERDGRTFMPLWLEPAGSVFVVFRKDNTSAKSATIVALNRNGRSVFPSRGEPSFSPPAVQLETRMDKNISGLAWEPGVYECKLGSGATRQVEVSNLPAPEEITGPWDVHFQANRGAPETIRFDELKDWTQCAEEGVKYFSGKAVYSKSFVVRSEFLATNRSVYLDLGRVAVIAQVKINGKDCGIWWKPPYRGEVTAAIHPGENQVEISVVNLWPNRMIGDEQLPEDSERNPAGTLKEWPQWLQENKSSPVNRYTFTSWRLWKKDSPLQESGLLGPVRLMVAQRVLLPGKNGEQLQTENIKSREQTSSDAKVGRGVSFAPIGTASASNDLGRSSAVGTPRPTSVTQIPAGSRD